MVPEERTEVLYGIENITNSTLDRFYSTKTILSIIDLRCELQSDAIYIV